MRRFIFALLFSLAALPLAAQPSNGYGSLNNFDAVNDNGTPCHGFEIEIEDIHSRDITYTYDWNHYGTPRITEDNSNPLHPKVRVTYESRKNPDGSWTAYTAVPSGPIAPTDGHQFTNPNINFGGEHFGVGFYGVPGAVRYHWLIDDGAGNLIHGTEVLIGTPTFIYYPPVNNVPAQVQAVVEVPEPAEIPVLEFGEAVWVKVITTETHNNNKVELRDLVSDDPDDPDDRNWRNDEPAEIEVEWELLQTEFSKVDGGENGLQVGIPEELQNGDEVITRRYEFFKYVGPLDDESGEAKASSVGPDDLHGEGIKTINGVDVDLSEVIVVGDYIGAQMAGFDAAGQLGLVDHLQDGEIGVPYVERSVVIGGTAPIITTLTGALPEGMDLDLVTGVLSGTPTVSGLFSFTVHSTDGAGGDVTMAYDLTITEAPIPPHSNVSTSALPAEGGTTSGDGDYENGTDITVSATANPGFSFLNWSENDTVVSILADYTFIVDANRELVANFIALHTISTSASPAEGGTTSGDGEYIDGSEVTVSAEANAGFEFVNWTENGVEVSTLPAFSFAASANRALVAHFAALPVFRNVGDLVSIGESGKSTTLDRRTRMLTSTSIVTITNGSVEQIDFPINLVITGLNPAVTMPTATGTTPAGNFYYNAPNGAGNVSLLPGQSVSITIKFVYPMSLRLAYGLEAWGTAP